MAIPYDTPHQLLPEACRLLVEKAAGKIAMRLHDHLSRPVEGGPSGGFPGFNAVNHRNNMLRVRRTAIDRWNRENPDSEPHTPLPQEIPNIEEMKALAKVRTKERHAHERHARHVNHQPHIEDFLANMPEDRHEELRAFIEHERELDHDHRAEMQNEMIAAGRDSSDIEHRIAHHKEAGLFGDEGDKSGETG